LSGASSMGAADAGTRRGIGRRQQWQKKNPGHEPHAQREMAAGAGQAAVDLGAVNAARSQR